MPKLCEGCGFYSADNTPAACPGCAGPLKFTFLPPAGTAAAPLPGGTADPYADLDRRQRAARAGALGVDWRIVRAVAVALVVCTGFGVRFWLRQEARDARAARESALTRIRPGMHISEAARLFDAGSGMPKWRGTVDTHFDADDDSDGSLELTDGRADLTVTWRNGIVTAVGPRGGTAGGTRRRATVVSAPGADEAGDDGPPPGPVVHPAERLVAPPGAGR